MTINIDQLDVAVNIFYEVGLTVGHTYTNNAGVTYAPVIGDATDPNEGSSTGEPKSEQSNVAVRLVVPEPLVMTFRVTVWSLIKLMVTASQLLVPLIS